jgi:hypothetical protein
VAKLFSAASWTRDGGGGGASAHRLVPYMNKEG